MSKVHGVIKSEQGFYVGDLCYALPRDIYDDIWCRARCKDGIYEVPGRDLKFAVAGTAYGDGTYEDMYSLKTFDVDAGNIALVPAELAESTDGGHYFEGAGEAIFTAEDGAFEISLPDGTEICINTREEYDYEDDYY